MTLSLTTFSPLSTAFKVLIALHCVSGLPGGDHCGWGKQAAPAPAGRAPGQSQSQEQGSWNRTKTHQSQRPLAAPPRSHRSQVIRHKKNPVLCSNTCKITHYILYLSIACEFLASHFTDRVLWLMFIEWRSWERLWWPCSSWIRTWAAFAPGWPTSRRSCPNPSPTTLVTSRRFRGSSICSR